MKYDGQLNLRGGVTPLMKLLLERRSVRKYREGAATPEQLETINKCVHAFQDRAGFRAPRLHLVDRGPEFDRVVKAAMSGVVGVVNPWLPLTRAQHLLLCGAVYPETGEPLEVERALKQASMTMQIAILAATEVGLATCWMAGINHEKVEMVSPLPDGARLIAMSPLGQPPKSMGLSWDTVLHHLVSRRRRPLESLRMAETWR